MFVIIIALGLLSLLTYCKRDKKRVIKTESKIRTNFPIYLLPILISAIISLFIFSKLKYGFFAYFIPSVSFVVFGTFFIILTAIFIGDKIMSIKKDHLFSMFLALIAGILIFLKTREIGWPFYTVIAVAVISFILIVLISILVLKQDKYPPEETSPIVR